MEWKRYPPLSFGLRSDKHSSYLKMKYTEWRKGGTLVSRGEISMGDLTSLLMYTVYVGSGLQMLTYVV